MRVASGDLFELARGNVLVITTNGFIKANGECVMGRGCAAEAKRRWPDMPHLLGDAITTYGNNVYNLGSDRDGYSAVISFPVKHKWWEHADLALIKASALQLVQKADEFKWPEIYMPRPGCGNGKLLWATVKREIEPILDDRFVVVDFA